MLMQCMYVQTSMEFNPRTAEQMPLTDYDERELRKNRRPNAVGWVLNTIKHCSHLKIVVHEDGTRGVYHENELTPTGDSISFEDMTEYFNRF